MIIRPAPFPSPSTPPERAVGAEVQPPELAEPDPAQGWPWDWACPQAATELPSQLAQFVSYLNHRYAWTLEQTVPPCWDKHGAVVEELTALMWSRHAAYQGPLASPEAAQNWHSYHLPLFRAHLVDALGGAQAAADCRAGGHRPSRVTAPPAAAMRL